MPRPRPIALGIKELRQFLATKGWTGGAMYYPSGQTTKVLHHGDNRECPEVQSGTWLYCHGHRHESTRWMEAWTRGEATLYLSSQDGMVRVFREVGERAALTAIEKGDA